MFASGTGVAEVSIWFQQIGLPAGEAEAFLAAILEAERQASRGEPVVTSGPWDFGGVFALRDNPLEKRRERKARREKSRRLAETEPDTTFDLGGDSYARTLRGEAHRSGPGARLRWVVLILGFLAVILVALVIAFSAFGGT